MREMAEADGIPLEREKEETIVFFEAEVAIQYYS